MKSDYTGKLEKLDAKLNVACTTNQYNINHLLHTGINNLLRLEYIYESGDIEKKRELIGSIYPEKLSFDGTTFRTTRISGADNIYD